MSNIFPSIVAIICGVFASSGFWAILQLRAEKRDWKSKMVLGLGHDRLMFLCGKYLDRGYITHDELENLHEYLFAPYEKLGGNGTVTRLIKRVDLLPIQHIPLDLIGEE